MSDIVNIFDNQFYRRFGGIIFLAAGKVWFHPFYGGIIGSAIDHDNDFDIFHSLRLDAVNRSANKLLTIEHRNDHAGNALIKFFLFISSVFNLAIIRAWRQVRVDSFQVFGDRIFHFQLNISACHEVIEHILSFFIGLNKIRIPIFGSGNMNQLEFLRNLESQVI